MKRLSILFIGLLSLGLLFNISVLADTNTSQLSNPLTTTLTLSSVIDLSIPSANNSLTDVTIDQANDLNSWNNSSTSPKSVGSFEIQIVALTSYEVLLGYSPSISSSNSTPSSLNTDPLKIEWSSGSDGDGTNTSGYIKNNGSGTVINLNQDFTGGNNITNPGENATYDLSIDPSKLTQDWDAGDSVTFTIDITVQDNTS